MFTELQLAHLLWCHGLARARVARSTRTADRDLGASAIEWAVISAILVTAAVLIGGVVYSVVRSKSRALETCANQPVGTAGC
jgi:Flp pilus assembly pilin Flp